MEYKQHYAELFDNERVVFDFKAISPNVICSKILKLSIIYPVALSLISINRTIKTSLCPLLIAI